ncbi:MAG TPA: ZIP family metal transporter [Planctomycetota bacterium]|nr:ZIP family metal transporter [Planctomycetota bacterium]HRR81754.1 ZIP family metal transporter [Planctomycetota bacterium]HRT94189.1 ZIP family metal transporter [Planctomycetota bacterium]
MTPFSQWHPVLQALAGGLFTWGVTAAGSVPVFFTRRLNQKFLDAMLGMAAGVMMAASYWSLLAPAIEMSERMGGCKWLPAVVGFLAGAAVLRVFDALLPHLHPDLADTPGAAEGLKSRWRRSILLVMAITLHNIPEGLAVGVAFGAIPHLTAGGMSPAAALGGAIALAVGIGLQNFPEGMAVAFPLRREGLSPARCFWYGQLSAIVEPIGAVLGAGLVLLVRPILPYALAFAAGAMIFVVAEELIPEAQREGNTDLATMGVIGGFAIMMFLDVALG